MKLKMKSNNFGEPYKGKLGLKQSNGLRKLKFPNMDNCLRPLGYKSPSMTPSDPTNQGNWIE